MNRIAIPIRELRPVALGLLAGAAIWPALARHISLPCPLRSLTGIPCPLCGMTTSVVATSRGRWGEAFSANPAGIMALVLAVWLVAARRKEVSFPPYLVFAMLAGMWIFQLFRFEVL